MDKPNPGLIAGFIKNGIQVIESVKGVPGIMLRNCAGVLLISNKEVGVGLFSVQRGSGVAMSRKCDSWSAPVAVSAEQLGFGVVAGRVEKDVLIVLNPLAMDRLLQGQGQLKIGADIGFAVGKTGGSGGTDIIASDKAGFGTSFVYTYSKGAFVGVEVESGAIVAVDYVNKAFYGKSDPKDIFTGDEDVPEGHISDLIAELHDKMAKRSGCDSGADCDS